MSPVPDRYQLGEQIGRGGASTVYRATDSILNKEVAYKQWDPPATGSFRELPHWRHPCLVVYHDCGSTEEGDYVTMDLIAGKSVAEIVKERELSVPELDALFKQMLSALHSAHDRRFLHGDIHPGNIVIADAAPFHAYLIDFTLRVNHVPEAGKMFGNIFTMPPEKFENQPYDLRSDLYSLGCTFFFAACGKYPFEGENSVEVAQGHLSPDRPFIGNLRPDLPGNLCALISTMMSHSPEVRPPTARQALALISTQ